MKILVIEDNKSLAKSLQNCLSQGYVTDIALTGKKGIYEAITNEYDLILLDLKLPDINGAEVCEELRREGLTTPILILTGEDSINSKVSLLNTGADDYVIKPFNLIELKARIRSLLRRSLNIKNNIITIGKLSINLNTKNIFYEGKILKFSKKEYLILQYLAHYKNTPISRLRLLEHVWEGEKNFNSNAIDVHIFNIRKKIKNISDNNIIKTVHGIGYKLCDDKSDKAS